MEKTQIITILLSATIFLIVTLLLVAILLVAKHYLVAKGSVKVDINDGKKDVDVLKHFLDKNAAKMPSVMLPGRYQATQAFHSS